MERRALALLWGVLAAAPCAAAGAVPAPAELPPILRLDDALRLLDAHGLDLLIAGTAVASAEGDERMAGAIANPALSASYGRSFTYGNCTGAAGRPAPCQSLPDAALGFGLSDQGAIFDALSGKRGLRLRTARAALEAARASRDDARRALQAQVKQAFLQVAVGQELLRTAQEVAAASARTAELTRARYDAGAISEAELARVDVARLEADQAAGAAAQALRDDKVALAYLLGVRGPVPDYQAAAPELLHAGSPAGLAGATQETLLARARAHRSDLRAARKQQERAEASLALARRQRFPDVALSVSYAQQGSTESAVTPPTITGGLSFPLPIFHPQEGEIAKAEADLASQELQASKVEAQVASEVATGLADQAAAGQRVQRMEGGLLARAARARELVSVQYQKGAASLLELLDAQRAFTAASTEYFQDLALYWGAVFRLERAVGEDLR
jgi:cobalt-zinc-cadmium efflux system outer membrane protein